jgi:hypothetical protein
VNRRLRIDRTVTALIATLVVGAAACGGSDPNPTTTTATGDGTTTTTAGPGAGAQLLPGSDDPAYAELAAAVGPDHGIVVAGITATGDDGGEPVVTVSMLGPLATGVAWSTIKVPMAMAVVEDGAGAALADDIDAALTASDNEAAMRLWQHLGGGTAAAEAVDAQLRVGGDENTRTEPDQIHPPYSPYGQTAWALADQARFALGQRCSSAGAEVAEVMRGVIPDQRWGLGATSPDIAFKGGWGPGSEPGIAGGYLVRQIGIMTVDGRDLGVAIAARPGDGAFETGTADLTAVAAWLTDNITTDAVLADGPCPAA